MSEHKPYDLSERDKKPRGIAADFRRRWMEAEKRIETLEALVRNLRETIEGNELDIQGLLEKLNRK